MELMAGKDDWVKTKKNIGLKQVARERKGAANLSREGQTAEIRVTVTTYKKKQMEGQTEGSG